MMLLGRYQIQGVLSMPANNRRSKSKSRRKRRMRLYDEKGSFYVVVRSPTTASRVGKFHNAVRRFVQTGNASKLRAFRGGFIVDALGSRHPLLTKAAVIHRPARG